MNNDIEKRVKKLENRVSVLEKALNSSSSFFEKIKKKQRPPAPREFLNKKAPKTDLDRILTIAVYHDRFIKPESCFNKQDISDLIEKAKVKKPSNINDTILKNVQKGYIEEDGKGEDGKKKWRVTQSGVSFVDANFKRDEQDT